MWARGDSTMLLRNIPSNSYLIKYSKQILEPKCILDHQLFKNVAAFMEDIRWNLQKTNFFDFLKQKQISDLYIFSYIGLDFHQNGSYRR